MFLFPPRPELAVSPELISFYENKNWWAQIKKNGTLQLITVLKDGEVIFKTRHNEDNKAWKPLPHHVSFFAAFRDSVFVAELIHSKHASIKNHLYVFDVLRYQGRDLVGVSLKDRVEMLSKVLPVNSDISLAQWHKQDLYGLFNSLNNPVDEGLVIKNPDAILESCLRSTANTSWQVKVRKAHKNYGF
jgi:hypothetical protein